MFSTIQRSVRDVESQQEGSPTSAIATTAIQENENEHILIPEDDFEEIELVKRSPSVSVNQVNKEGPSRSFKLFLLSTLSIQTAGFVLLGRYTRSSVPPSELYDIKHLVFFAETTKFIISSTMEHLTTGGKLLDSLETHVYQRPMDSLKPAIPALLYVLQNALAYTALTHLSAPLYLALSQGKLVSTVLVTGMLLNRRYNLRQWICVSTLSMGVAVILISDSNTNSQNRTTMLGFLAVIGACLCSAFASVYFEGVMKRSEGSLWLRNIQLSFFGILTTGLQSIYEGKPLGHGFSASVWCLILMQAGGGLLTAAVMKYTDNVLKGLAFGVSVILTSLISNLFFDVWLTNEFLFGACIILVSVYFFSNSCSIPRR